MTLLWKKDSFLAIAAYTSDAALKKDIFLTIAAYTSDAALEERLLSDYSGLH